MGLSNQIKSNQIKIFKRTQRRTPRLPLEGITTYPSFCSPGFHSPLVIILLAAPWSTRPLFSRSCISLHLDIADRTRPSSVFTSLVYIYGDFTKPTLNTVVGVYINTMKTKKLTNTERKGFNWQLSLFPCLCVSTLFESMVEIRIKIKLFI